jgi:(R)-benzylsuccinyl-CoA dehydrogenase
MNFELPRELIELQNLVKKFVQKELMPLEKTVIEREANRGLSDTPVIPPEDNARLTKIAHEIGLAGIDVPEEFGGHDMGALVKAIVVEEMSKSIVPFTLPPDAPNLNYLLACCNEDQKERYLIPYSRGEKTSCLALTEPNAGSDAGAIQMSAVKQGSKWILNGTKTFISNAPRTDFMITLAVSDRQKGKKGGITAFLVDKGTQGVTIARGIPTIGELHPYEVVFENVELDDSQVLGEVGMAFVPLQNRLGVRRMEIAARCLGMAQRLLDMMIDYSKQRETFGKPLADRQAVQWWIADSAMDIHATRLMIHQACWKVDQGVTDVRKEAAMTKVYATEMLTKVADRCIQLHGGYGLTKDLPIEFIYRLVRIFRIVEGPSEVHRWLIARELIKES